MFSFNTKPVMIWALLFLSVGFCKICYTVIYKLSAFIMLQFEPTNVSMWIFIIVISVLAPILSIIASVFLFRSLYTAANRSPT
jgi:hypothetical protein